MLSSRTSEGFGLAICQTSFLGLVWGSTWVSFICVVFRGYFRLKVFRRLFFDDALVFLAWVMLLITAVIWQRRVYIIYYVIDISNGVIYPPPADLWDLVDKQVHQGLAVTILNLVSLWCVKFSFLALFLKLGRNVRGQKPLWQFVLVFTVATLAVSIGVQAYGCVFGDIVKISAKCSQPAEGRYIRAILRVQAAVDVVSDCFIAVIPLTLLWVVRLNLRLKLEIGAVFCLTIFTMIAAIVRVVMSIKGPREDDSWIFSWSAIEIAVGTVPPSPRDCPVPATFPATAYLALSIAIIISCLVTYRASSKKQPVKKSYDGEAGKYPLEDLAGCSSTALHHHEASEQGGKSSSTSNWDEEMLPLPHAIHVRNDYVVHQTTT